MAVSQSTHFAAATALFGVLSFVLAIAAELNKPPHGTPIRGMDAVVCRFPPDPTAALAAACCAGSGAVSVFFPYNDRSIPTPEEGTVRLHPAVRLLPSRHRRHGGRRRDVGVGGGDGGHAPRPERARRPRVRLPDGQDRGARRRGVPQPRRLALLARLPHARRQRQGGLLRRRQRRRQRRGDRGEVNSINGLTCICNSTC